MRLTILELAARWNAPDRVLADVDAMLAAGHGDLVLLPEASIRGYVSPTGNSDLSRFAEPIDGQTATACASLARAHAVHLVAPLVLSEDAALYNAMACFDPDGALVFVYRKRHPWLPEQWASRGFAPPPVVSIAGVKLSIAICYDVHFLESDAATELAAADLLLFPSAWVEEPDYRIPRLSRLARHFDLTVANANWAPGDIRVPGQGGSCIIGPTGSVVAQSADGRIDYTFPDPR